MNERSAYDVVFDWSDVHGRLVTLLADRPQRGVVVDLGCGYAPHAEHLRDAGFTFVGFDVNDRSLDAVRLRGFDARRLDLGDLDAVRSELDALANAHDEPGAGEGAAIVGVVAIDVVEHLVEPQLFLDLVAGWMLDHDVAVLGVSIPNVSYRDVSAKLLAGRWDVTQTGLLDHTHLRFFTDRSLTAVMNSVGLEEVARDDRVTPTSDQHWPAGSSFVAPASRLGGYLRAVRDRSDPYGDTHQFVRLYAPTPGLDREPTLLTEPGSTVSGLAVWFARSDASEAVRVRKDLEAQTSGDWEIIDDEIHLAGCDDLDGSDTLQAGSGRDNVQSATLEDFGVTDGLEHLDGGADLDTLLADATGSHVVVIGAGERVGPEWAATLLAAARVRPGVAVRCGAEIGGREIDRPDDVALLAGVLGPPAAIAIPIEAFRMGHDTAARIEMCGVVDVADVCVHLESGWTPLPDDPPPPGTQIAPNGAMRELVALRADNAWLNSELRHPAVRILRRLLLRS